MTCPLCGADVDVSTAIRNVLVCPSCKRSLAVDQDALRVATGADTTILSPDDLKALRELRGRSK